MSSLAGARLVSLLQAQARRREPDVQLCAQLLVTLETFPSLAGSADYGGAVRAAREHLNGLPPLLKTFMPRARDLYEGRVLSTGGVHDGSEGLALAGRLASELLVLQESALVAPDDSARWLVLADALLAAAHPLGEWMMKHRDREPGDAELGEQLGSMARRLRAQWELGLMTRVRLEPGSDLAEVLRRLAAHPLARALQRLELTLDGDEPAASHVLVALAEQLWPVALHSVRLRLVTAGAHDAYVQRWAELRRAWPALNAQVEVSVEVRG